MDNLDSKIEISYRYLSEILKKQGLEKLYVSWTGGKDSTVVLHLFLEFLKEKKIKFTPKVLFIDTGFTFPEIREFMGNFSKIYNFNLTIIKPDVDLKQYPKEDVILCCRDLKIKPLKKAISDLDIKVVLTGVRRDENESRRNVSWLEHKKEPQYLQVNPIVHWKESDVWAYHIKNNLPYCSLYDMGYRSIDCIPCTNKATKGERSGRNPKKEQELEKLHSLGYF